MSFFSFLRTSGDKIFPYFEKQASCFVSAAGHLADLVRVNDISERRNHYRNIKLCETQGDAVITTLYEEMVEIKSTPFDRADVQALEAMLDDFLDMINDSAKRIIIYLPKRIDSQIIELADYIKEDAVVLESLLAQLKFLGKRPMQVLQQCERITQIEHASDDVFGEYMTFLFENEKDAIELVKYKNIVEAFEDTTDCAKEVSGLIRKIAMEK
ncbi:hypothetical protein B5F83_04740 [Muribaculum sp. An289]|uniref:DUF47 domain-containing protein n=1 Tax=Muribaculum sp. An289 TaxID=1965624 RepID=UPI000B37C8BF|nr:DUF47 family protein [Muribaculum sp. An289]OUO37534.1 hypothetical protein B5F83_04740 [Muribaculum sp. An289]